MEVRGSQQQSNASGTIAFELSGVPSEIIPKMESGGSQQQPHGSATTVVELLGELAIVINGMPGIIPSDNTHALCKTSSTVEAPVHSGLGEW